MGDRDALLYYRRATEFFEEATEAHQAEDMPAAISAIKQGIHHLAIGLRLVTTQKGKQTLTESLEFWTDTLAELQAEEVGQLPFVPQVSGE